MTLNSFTTSCCWSDQLINLQIDDRLRMVKIAEWTHFWLWYNNIAVIPSSSSSNKQWVSTVESRSDVAEKWLHPLIRYLGLMFYEWITLFSSQSCAPVSTKWNILNEIYISLYREIVNMIFYEIKEKKLVFPLFNLELSTVYFSIKSS